MCPSNTDSWLTILHNPEVLLSCKRLLISRGSKEKKASSFLGKQKTLPNSTEEVFSGFPQVLCSNSLLESTDYWLQNQRTPCQIGFVEDRSENTACASVSKHSRGRGLRKRGCRHGSSGLGQEFPTSVNARLHKSPLENM